MIRLSITLPEDIYKQLKKRAEDNLRSISNEIAYELAHSYVPQPLQPQSQTPTLDTRYTRRQIID